MIDAHLPGACAFRGWRFQRSHLVLYLDDLLTRGKSKRWGEFGVGLLPIDPERGLAKWPRLPGVACGVVARRLPYVPATTFRQMAQPRVLYCSRLARRAVRCCAGGWRRISPSQTAWSIALPQGRPRQPRYHCGKVWRSRSFTGLRTFQAMGS